MKPFYKPNALPYANEQYPSTDDTHACTNLYQTNGHYPCGHESASFPPKFPSSTSKPHVFHRGLLCLNRFYFEKVSQQIMQSTQLSTQYLLTQSTNSTPLKTYSDIKNKLTNMMMMMMMMMMTKESIK